MFDLNLCFTYAYSAGTWADFEQTVNTDEASTNIIDLDKANIKISGVHPPWLIVKQGQTVYDALTSIEIMLETDSDSGFATTLKQVGIWHVALADGLDTIGANLVNQPIGGWTFQRYLRLYFNVVGSADSGTILAYLANGPEPAIQDIDLVGV